MCGIAGFIDKNANYDSPDYSRQMGNAILHRGPDSDGFWHDNDLGVNLIHRRLAILELSPAGHQPMVSNTGRYVMVFNGEIYNFKSIARKLEGKLGEVSWRGHSDTEVLLLAFDTYGITDTLALMEGMFAIALWDRQDQQLTLIRDRMGEKPLYYGYSGGVFLFASELKAIKAHPKFNGVINRDALGQMMLHNCIPAPLSIYEGIYKLLPGHLLQFKYGELLNNQMVESNAYWSLDKFALGDKYTAPVSDAVNDLEDLLKSVISEQMVADVPVGCFLSGGVDSSAIAALMQSMSSKQIQTFSIGFDNPEYDEAQYAMAVAKHLGTKHTELYVTDKDALGVIPNLASIYDEPFSDSSQIPTYLVSKLAKSHVTVALSGDAGDELFAGYTRYLLAEKISKKISMCPMFLRKLLASSCGLITPSIIEKLNTVLKLPITNFSDKANKIAGLLRAKDFNGRYIALTGHWLNHNQLVLGNTLDSSLWLRDAQRVSNISTMQYLDTRGYLPDDILVKVDRAAMANSLETRVPFLNHRVVEFANSLPDNYKIMNGATKYPLREVLYRYVPRDLIERPKKGFGIPIHQWLRGELREWCTDLLSSDLLKSQGYFNVALVEQKLKDHMSGKSNNGFYLWDVLMFQQWLINGENNA